MIVELLAVVVALGVLAVVGYVAIQLMDSQRRLAAELGDDDLGVPDNPADETDETDETTEPVLEPPDVDSGFLGVLKQWRHNKRATKLAKKGYIRWYKVGASWSRPRWVKPEKAGQGEYRVRENDETYYFPKDALLTDQRTGAWVAVHREGEATPINLRDPGMPAMDADRAEELLQLSAESDAPGFFSNIDSTTIMWVAIGGVLLLAAGSQVLGI